MLTKLKATAAFLVLGFALSAGTVGCIPGSSGSCCRVCTTGKPCGNSCISRTSTCNKGAGCACYGDLSKAPVLAEVSGGR